MPSDLLPTPVAANVYDRRGAAQYLCVHRETISRLVERGELRHVRVNDRGDLRFRRQWLDDWMEHHAVGGVMSRADEILGEITR